MYSLPQASTTTSASEEGDELLDVEQLVAYSAIEALHERVLPRGARLDVGRRRPGQPAPVPQGGGDELGAVVHAQVAGAPRVTTRASMTATTSAAVQVRPPAWPAPRVCSSTTLNSFSLRWSAVSSNWNSRVHTWLGRSARNRGMPVSGRRRLPHGAGRLRPWRALRILSGGSPPGGGCSSNRVRTHLGL